MNGIVVSGLFWQRYITILDCFDSGLPVFLTVFQRHNSILDYFENGMLVYWTVFAMVYRFPWQCYNGISVSLTVWQRYIGKLYCIQRYTGILDCFDNVILVYCTVFTTVYRYTELFWQRYIGILDCFDNDILVDSTVYHGIPVCRDDSLVYRYSWP